MGTCLVTKKIGYTYSFVYFMPTIAAFRCSILVNGNKFYIFSNYFLHYAGFFLLSKQSFAILFQYCPSKLTPDTNRAKSL